MKNYIFVLLENFSLLAFSSAIEPLRLANRMSKEKKFIWKLISVEKNEVKCSNGTKIICDGNLDTVTNRGDTIIICGGTNIKENMSKKLLGWLRKEARRGLSIGGLCTASQILAKAGLLDNKK